MNTLRVSLAVLLAALPLSSALACGGGMSDSDMNLYAAQHHVLLTGRVSARTLHKQLDAMAAQNLAMLNGSATTTDGSMHMDMTY